jgi:hypothetical protein
MSETLTDAEKAAINAASHEVQRMRALADAMDRHETVTVSWAHARGFREITSMPWSPCYQGIEISADDVVRPADSWPII